MTSASPFLQLDASLTIRSWWKVKPMGVSEVHGGLVPSAYVESVSARQTATYTLGGVRSKYREPGVLPCAP